MKISGFTIAKNATKLYYPVKAAIASILPIVDEFVVALGDCDEDDHTEQEILSIGSDKIKIIRTTWDTKKYPNGMEYARQTDIAKSHCTGDWLFYIQSDEVVHEKYLPEIRANCEKYLSNTEVEGFLFNYKHFWGDYDHFVLSHAWYPREIRIVRNDREIHSWRDAQSFRRIPAFDGQQYYQKAGTFKLKVIALEAYVYHYGFVRPPALMQRKNKNHHANYRGNSATEDKFKRKSDLYDYGDLSKLHMFKETHPEVMDDFIQRFNWRDQLRYEALPGAGLQKHEKPKYQLLTFIEQNLMGGRQLFGFKNYRIIGRA
jgi:hypothetical protein